MPYKDKEKQKEHGKKYYIKNKYKIIERQKENFKKPETKKRIKEYNQKPEVKEKKNIYMKSYYQRLEVKEHYKQYGQKLEVKEKRRIYDNQRDGNLERIRFKKEYIKKYFKKPEIKKKHNKYMKEYRADCKQKENQRRKKSGLPLIGEGYRSEMELFLYVSSLFRDEEIIRHNRSLLDGLEMDIYIPSLKLAFEYNGIQHYEYNPHFHRNYNDFEIQQFRDRRTQELCKLNNIKLIIFRYDEKLSLQLVLQKLKSNDIEFKTQTDIKQYII